MTEVNMELARNNGEIFILCLPTKFSSSELSRKDNHFMLDFNYTLEQATTEAVNTHKEFQKAFSDNGVACKIVKQLHPDAYDSVFISDPFCCIRNKYIPDGVIFITPMYWPHRRLEKNSEVIEFVTKTCGYKHVVDLSYFEKENKALEGRGTLLFDWKGKMVYTSRSNRSNEDVLKVFVAKLSELSGEKFDYLMIDSLDPIHKTPHFHCVCFFTIFEKFALGDVSSFQYPEQLEQIKENLKKSGIDFIPVSHENMLNGVTLGVEVHLPENKKGIIFSHLVDPPDEIKKYYDKIIKINIKIFEAVGGGNIECMTQIVKL